MSVAVNPYAQLARERKAGKIATVLERIGANPAALTDEQWSMAAQAAGVKPPSLETRALVAAEMKYRKEGTEQ